MRIKTGETATASLPVKVQYRCSACGKDNLISRELTGSYYTRTVLGVNTSDVRQGVRNELMAQLNTILDQNNLRRFKHGVFNCRCGHCGNIEPWAKMNNFNDLAVPKGFSLIMIFISVLLMIATYSRSPGLLSMLALSIAAYVGIGIYQSKNGIEKLEQMITSLPAESLPTILLPQSRN